jgi:hypothetical protein
VNPVQKYKFLHYESSPPAGGFRLPSGKHTGILTHFQTKVNKKRPKIAKILAVSGHPEPLYYIGIQRWKSVSENVKWKRQIIIG